MARRKGSKNVTLTADEKIAAVTSEIESLTAQVNAKKQELKELKKQKEDEDKKKLLDAIAASGKSFDEVMSLLQGEEQN